ncbi:hypothetical protein ENKO_563 [Klebsiella phage fENko-Kae01]|nr:hypothetical protein [Klebsiella phage fENko-Kae01]WNV47659.1 hypothetical protein [Klebsiella phage fENko-Kae01]
MKNIVSAIAIAVMFSSTPVMAYTVNLNELTDWGNQMRDRFAVPDHIQPQQKQGSEMLCRGVMTNEQTGQQIREQFSTSGERSVSGNDIIYHDEDETGSTTLQINAKTGKGFITMMDTEKVIVTGNVVCK